MKAGLATSVALHAVLLGIGMVSLSAPKAFEVADVESLPVDIVPFEEISQAQIGEKKAPMADKPAPLPTKRPETVPEAQKVGDADVDTDLPPTPAPKPKPVQKAEEPAPAPEPTPKPVEKPIEQAKVEPPKPVPTPEPPKPAEKPVPPKEPTPQAPAEVTPKETAAAENVQLPDSAPVPQSRPKPEPQKQPEKVAEKPKPVEKPAEKPKPQTQKAESNKKDVLDEVAALLNKEQAAGGGAKRSTEQAALGSTKKNTGQKLSQNEMDALRSRIQQCWNVPAGAMDAENIKFSIQFKLSPSGEVEGRPEVIKGDGNSTVYRAAVESARRAILKCGPYTLPAEKYEAWADIILNFDPSDMF